MSSNITNSSKLFNPDWMDEWDTIRKIERIAQIIYVVVGTLLNLWFILAILTSREMRSRLRNKIICSTFAAHLLDTGFLIPIRLLLNSLKIRPDCQFLVALHNLHLIQDFIANWLIVILIVVFIAQIQEIDLTSKLSPKAVTVGTIGLLVLPWVAAFITVVPVIVHDFNTRDVRPGLYCYWMTLDLRQVFKSIDTAIPILLAILFLIVAAVLRYRRFTQRSLSDSMETELVSRGPEIDNISAYVAAVTGFTLCDLLLFIHSFIGGQSRQFTIIVWIRLTTVAWTFSNVRTLLMPLTWLLLPDVRQRIKTWRPWYCPAPVIDLTFTYRKDEN